MNEHDEAIYYSHVKPVLSNGARDAERADLVLPAAAVLDDGDGLHDVGDGGAHPPNTNFSNTSRPARELQFGTDTHCVGF